jgi:ParB/RepB/Spo0J family partition protein
MTTFDTLRLDALVTSPTNPRKNFNPIKLQELADSIAASGVHQSILVRPLPADRLADTAHLDPRPTHEVVAGERRYRASKLAKCVTIPAMIRNLTDDQVLEIQIVENIQRDSLTELETAEGYKTLMEHNNLTAEQVGQKVSKSRSSVYGSLKLLDLHAETKQALREELITSSAALLIARIPDVALQTKALAYASTQDENGHTPSIRNFQAWLRDNVMLDLSKAPFPIALVSLTPAGSCTDCDKRTGANPDLFTDVKSADVCTHPPCYHIKAVAHKDALAAKIADIPKEKNKNVDDQNGLGLESTLAQDARAQQRKDRSADQLRADIQDIKHYMAQKTAAVVRIATFDAFKDHIKRTQDEHTHDLIAVAMLRAWLIDFIDRQDEDSIGEILDITIDPSINSEYAAATALQDRAVLRIQAASEADIYRYTALAFLLEERVVNNHCVLEPTPLFDAFASEQGFDIGAIRVVAQEEAEATMKEKIAALNKQIKDKKGEYSAPKTTSTPPPAGAAIGDAAAGAENKGKNKTPAAQARKSKTSTEEAISGIAAAMQGIEAEPTGASLESSEAAAVQTGGGVLAAQAAVKVLDGKHKGKTGTITSEVGNDMWNVTLYSTVGMPFATFLPTKSLEVITL